MMENLVFAAIADDDTGASDLAGMLAEQRVSTLLVIDLPAEEQFLEWSHGCDAVVMAEGTRNLAPALAREKARQALQIAATREPRVVEVKYCSTFDSTLAGNIGPAIDAAMDELSEGFTIALPALPVNGRTTKLGHHYVNGQPLSESPMRNHPLTPMTNSNLVEWLQHQTRRKVGLASLQEVEEGVEGLTHRFQELREQGVA
ncbi:MAG: four-carbon acid sugar kinase family protein, partial [Burkholderiales bacterium]